MCGVSEREEGTGLECDVDSIISFACVYVQVATAFHQISRPFMPDNKHQMGLDSEKMGTKWDTNTKKVRGEGQRGSK